MKPFDHLEDSQIHAYLDDELEPEWIAPVESHLEQCAFCRSKMEELRALFGRLESVDEVPLSRDLAGPVMAELSSSDAMGAGLRWVTALEVLVAGALLGVIGLAGARGTLFRMAALVFRDELVPRPSVEVVLRESLAALQATIQGWTSAGMSHLRAFDAGGLAGQIPWIPVIAGLLAIWLMGNGLLLRDDWAGGGMMIGRITRKEGNHG